MEKQKKTFRLVFDFSVDDNITTPEVLEWLRQRLGYSQFINQKNPMALTKMEHVFNANTLQSITIKDNQNYESE